MWASTGLLVFFVVSTSSGKITLNTNIMTDKFVCSAGKCTQAKMVKDAPLNTTFDSIELCRLLCPKYGTLWPLPTSSADMSQQVVELNLNNIQATYNTPNEATTSYLENAFRILKENIFIECEKRTPTKPDTQLNIVISITSASLDLDLKTDESYKLYLTTRDHQVTVNINAVTVYGARHALETVLQLTARTTTSTGACSTFIVDSAVIKDQPVFKYRGVLLDTSRNYLSVNDIKKVFDAMASVKLNIFHWHITDSHSFPLVIRKLPLLAKYGAYSSKEVYTPENINDLVEYGKLRGIRILMEIDAPAHSGNGWDFGEDVGLGKLVVCLNSEQWRAYCFEPPCGQLNPGNLNIYPTLRNIYEEIQQVIPSNEIFHMGGDEVHFGCWNSSKEVVDYMTSIGLPRTKEGFIELWAEFQKKALAEWDAAIGHNKTKPILWSSDLTKIEYIEKYLDKKRYIIQTWTGVYDQLPEDLVERGYEVIYATKDTWYLDHGFWGNTQYHNWRVVYDYIIPEDEKVLGGEVMLWGELVDSDNLETKLWPRASAIAERLWTSSHLTSLQVMSRFLEARQRLRRRGHQIDQITPEWCYLNDGKCL